MRRKIQSGVSSMATGVVRVKATPEAPEASEPSRSPSFDTGLVRPRVLFYAVVAATVFGLSVEARPFMTLIALIVQILLISLFVKITVFQRI